MSVFSPGTSKWCQYYGAAKTATSGLISVSRASAFSQTSFWLTPSTATDRTQLAIGPPARSAVLQIYRRLCPSVVSPFGPLAAKILCNILVTPGHNCCSRLWFPINLASHAWHLRNWAPSIYSCSSCKSPLPHVQIALWCCWWHSMNLISAIANSNTCPNRECRTQK